MEPKLKRIIDLLNEFDQFRACGPSDDLELHSIVCVDYHHLVTQLKIMASPYLPKYSCDLLNSVKVELDNIYSVYLALPIVSALLGDIREIVNEIDGWYFGPPKKDRILSAIKDLDGFQICTPSADPDMQFGVCDGYFHLVTQLQIMALPYLPESIAEPLRRVEVELDNLTSVYEARAIISALLGDIHDVIEGLDESVFDPAKVEIKTERPTTSVLIAIADALQNVYSELAGPNASETAFITHPNMFGMPDSTELQLPNDSKGMYELCDSALKMMAKVIGFYSSPIKEAVEVSVKYVSEINKISDGDVVQQLVKAKASISKLDVKLKEFVRLHQELSNEFQERFTSETTSEKEFNWLLHHLSEAYANLVDGAELKVINDASYVIRSFGELGIAKLKPEGITENTKEEVRADLKDISSTVERLLELSEMFSEKNLRWGNWWNSQFINSGFYIRGNTEMLNIAEKLYREGRDADYSLSLILCGINNIKQYRRLKFFVDAVKGEQEYIERSEKLLSEAKDVITKYQGEGKYDFCDLEVMMKWHKESLDILRDLDIEMAEIENSERYKKEELVKITSSDDLGETEIEAENKALGNSQDQDTGKQSEETSDLKRFIENHCVLTKGMDVISRKTALFDANKRKLITLPTLARPYKKGRANVYYVKDLKSNWQEYRKEVSMPALKE